MNVVDSKNSLHEKRVLKLLSYSLYRPTEERLNRLADNYKADDSVSAFACIEGENVVGAVVIKRMDAGAHEILNIAVEPAFREQGIGARLVSHISEQFPHSLIRAETDDDAVGFYRACGFGIESLGEKYPGIVRYLCTLKTP